MTRQGLGLALRVIGGVATAAGIHDLTRGVGRVLGTDPDTALASIDSELRFGSAWYATAGLLYLVLTGAEFAIPAVLVAWQKRSRES